MRVKDVRDWACSTQGLDDKFFQHMHEKRQGIRPAGRLCNGYGGTVWNGLSWSRM